ncbi:MAG: DUF4876 domain-containing protein [Bacteroidales bacterium]
MKVFKYFVFLFVLGVVISSCKKNQKDEAIPVSVLKIQVTSPSEIKAKSLEGLTISLKNISTGNIKKSKLDSQGIYTSTVEEGTYNITVSGTIKLAQTDETTVKELSLSAVKENFAVSGANVNLNIEAKVSLISGGWIFKELYFRGSKRPTGKPYMFDNYFVLVNNSSEVMYADGLSISESDHLTAFQENKWIGDIENKVVVHTIYTIPGNGKDYPIQPGETVVIADRAIDHTIENSNSVNLSKANFEWFDNDKANIDIDIPEVTNMIKNFSYSATVWLPHSRGYRSYFLFKPENMKTYLAENRIDKKTNSGKISTVYSIPNEMILDAVELSTPDMFKSKTMSSAIDLSYTFCDQYGKGVRRKVDFKLGDRAVFKDNNDSANDFISNAELSLK